MATLAGHGQAQVWDLATAEIHPISAATAEGDSVRFPLVLGPYEAKVVVVGPLPSGWPLRSHPWSPATLSWTWAEIGRWT